LFAAEQGRQKAEINYDPQTRLVTLELIIQDSSGYFIPNIRRENFAVYENGIRQPEPSVDIEHAAVCAGVLVEYGGRYHALSEARASAVSMAVGQFADEIESQDTVAIWKYADRVEELSGFSKGNGALQQAAPNLRSTPPFSELNFYDALISTLPRLEEQSGRRALILFSSGIDTFSKATYPDALRAAGRSSAPIYAINVGPATRGDASLYGLNGPYARLDWKSAESNLGHIAQASGGRMYSPQSILDLSGVYDDLMENLRVRYVISYRSTVRPGEHGPRTVRVELVDSRTGGPLHIVDADGKPVHARVIAAVSYDPDRGTTS
jgi:VWFA-related protein